MSSPTSPHPSARTPVPSALPEALEDAADKAVLAPSVHNTQPWRIILHPDRLDLRADRTRQLTRVDPAGRERVQSVGAALCNARVALAAAGWAVEVDRLPREDDPDLLAVVRPVDGEPDTVLAELAPAMQSRHTNRRRFEDDRLPDDVLDELSRAAAAEDTQFVPVLRLEHQLLLAQLTQTADGVQNADAAYRAGLRHWTTRRPADGDGVPAAAVPHVDGRQHDSLPLRDFDTAGAGALPAETHSGTAQSLVLLASRDDDAVAWLRSGEALERLLLGITRLGWAASPMTQAIEVPLTRTQLRSALTWAAHPQNLLRIGRAVATPPTPCRPRSTVVESSTRPPEPPAAPPAPPRIGWPVDHTTTPSVRRPVSDGRGGTTWM